MHSDALFTIENTLLSSGTCSVVYSPDDIAGDILLLLLYSCAIKINDLNLMIMT